VRANWARHLVDFLVPKCKHELAAAKIIWMLANLINRSKCVDADTFQDIFVRTDVGSLRKMGLNDHIMNRFRGDSRDSALSLLICLYE